MEWTEEKLWGENSDFEGSRLWVRRRCKESRAVQGQMAKDENLRKLTVHFNSWSRFAFESCFEQFSMFCKSMGWS